MTHNLRIRCGHLLNIAYINQKGYVVLAKALYDLFQILDLNPATWPLFFL